MYSNILVPTDGSSAAKTAAKGAVNIAVRTGAKLHAIHVTERGTIPRAIEEQIQDELLRYGEQTVTQVEELASEAGVDVVTTVINTDSHPTSSILDYAETHDIDCIAMGTHGRTGLARLALGSITERTLREAPVPVMTVHEEVDFGFPFDRVLLPIDGSEGADAAADHAISIATETGAAVHIIHVVDAGAFAGAEPSAALYDALEQSGQDALDAAVEKATTAGVSSVEASLVNGRTATAITGYAEDHAINCIVMGTHGRSGFERLLLGSVSERVIRTANVPVIAVKHPDSVAA